MTARELRPLVDGFVRHIRPERGLSRNTVRQYERDLKRWGGDSVILAFDPSNRDPDAARRASAHYVSEDRA